jgi:hypothetical protein
LAGCDLLAYAKKLAINQQSMLRFNSKEGAINLILSSNEASVEQIEVLHLGGL